jgi:signal transduction histidine kinase
VGIAGMHERIEQLGGSLEITSDEHGTIVRTRVPLVRDAA